MSDKKKQRSGTKDISLDTAKSRIFGRRRDIDSIIEDKSGGKKRKNQSTDDSQ